VTTTATIDLLTAATTDLWWSSEGDYPLTIVKWPPDVELNPAALLDRSVDQIESISLAELFDPVLQVEDWYDAAELATVERYQQLKAAIESNLTDVRVFRVGEVEVNIYIVGKSVDGDIIGIKTQAIET
jgi:hypothetical protein